MKRLSTALLASCWAATSAPAALTPQQVAQLPPPDARKVDFVRDIQPIIEVSCTQCHGRGKDKGGLSMETRAAFLKGGDSGAVVVPGKSVESYVIETISGLDPDNVMHGLTRDCRGRRRSISPSTSRPTSRQIQSPSRR
jgi:hypothetical protein